MFCYSVPVKVDDIKSRQTNTLRILKSNHSRPHDYFAKPSFHTNKITVISKDVYMTFSVLFIVK